ncbi:MAG: GNAT family N-acetyltransferase [Alphaproteobacteria bacterium]|nr:GNAT family N-acetyltransferase [Alphaproteobacteria bacterium]
MNLRSSFTEKPDVSLAIKLYLSIGWGKLEQYDLQRFEKAFENSKFMTVYDGDVFIGFIRFFSDENQDTSIIEFIVTSKYQGLNVGKWMLQEFLKKYGKTNIYIETTERTKDFFLKNGFKKHRLVGLSRTGQD